MLLKGPVSVKAPPVAAVTVKLVAEVAVDPPAVTVIAPLVAVAGTVAISCVEVALVTVAGTLLKLTVLLAAVELKLVPAMVTAVPGAPEVGVKLDIAGDVPVTEAGLPPPPPHADSNKETRNSAL